MSCVISVCGVKQQWKSTDLKQYFMNWSNKSKKHLLMFLLTSSKKALCESVPSMVQKCLQHAGAYGDILH